MGPCTGPGSGGTQISSTYNIRWRVSIPSIKCDLWSCDTQISSTYLNRGSSEQEGNLSFKFSSIKVCNICYLA